MKTIEIIEAKNKSEIEQFNGYVEDVIEQKDIFYSNPLINSICESLDIESGTMTNGITEIQINSRSGNGKIDFTTFENQLTVINFDVCLNDDLVIETANKKETLYFLYNLDGSCYHSFNYADKHSKVNELSTVSFASSRNHKNQLIIKKGLPFKCNIIAIDRDVYVKSFVSSSNLEQLSKLNEILDTLKEQLIKCPSSLEISKELRIINTKITEECVTSSLQLQSRYQLVLSQHLEQLYTETFHKQADHNISKSEIQKIRSITSHIIENPGLNHSQDKLCSQFFVSQSKLQAGFKAVHKTTVSNFTRNTRLEKSEELLTNSELNISEIVYTVGFTSRSYFSKIFKQKYECNPTAYRAQINQRGHQISNAI